MIYGLVWTADDSVVKIGYTSSPRDEPSIESVSSRMMSMQTGHWREMVCIAMAPGNHARETAWHHEFDHYRVKGEWFLRYREVDAWCRKYAVEPMPVSEMKCRRLAEHISRARSRVPLHAIERHTPRKVPAAQPPRPVAVQLDEPARCAWPKPCVCERCERTRERREAELEQWLLASVGK